MHRFGRYFVVAIVITMVFLANTVNIAFSPVLLSETESTQEFSAEKESMLRPTRSNSDLYSRYKEMDNRKPESGFQNLWGFDVFNMDTRSSGIEERDDFPCADEDSAELVIGVNNAEPEVYASLIEEINKSQGEIVNTVSIRGEVIAVVADIPLNVISSFAQKVQGSGLARYIEPNMRFQAQFVPNDEYWSLQWGPQKIEADYAWNTTTGDSSILVAVIDTGIDYDHPDLTDNYVSLGRDWVNDDDDPLDDNGHGTHCAGIIAAVLNNTVGIAGIANVSIMAEKGLDSGGWGTEVGLAQAIIHAVDQDADILSNSWGGYGESLLIHDAVQHAHDSGVLVIAAAGNEAWSKKLYPAAHDEVVAVTATDSSDNPAWWTNFGDWVEVAAPGVDIYSTMPTYHVTLNDPPYDLNLNYDYLDGASMACPHVAGVAALIWSQFPNATRDWVRAQSRYTADDLGDAGFDEYYGYGRINARKAVEQAPPDHDLLIFDWEKPAYIQPGDIASFNVTVLNFGASDEENVAVQLLVDENLTDSTLISHLAEGTSTTVSLSWNPLVERTCNVTLYVVPVAGEDTTANNVISMFMNVQYLSVALFKNMDPWGYPTNEEVLSLNGIAYAVFSSSDFGVIDLSSFSKAIIASDQDQAFYDAVSIYRWWFENYVSGGGVLEIHAADWGWNGGGWVGTLPGELTWYHYYADYVTIVDPTHPVVTVPNEITDFELDGWFFSVHGYFSSYPASSHVVIEEDSTGYPAYLEFDYGAGAIIASSQPLEWAYANGYSLILENSLLYTPIKYPHELVVALEAPDFLEPDASSLLNATVYNCGLNNETDVELQLLIDGSIVNNVTIPELVNGTSHIISHLWTPSVEATYNITAYAPPVPDENVTLNNVNTKYAYVQYPLINPVEGQYANYILYYYDSSGYLIGTGYWNFTYDYYVEPYKIYITVWLKDPSGYTTTGWMIVNTMNRMVEADSGIYWTGMWYPGWIETNIDLGSTINLLTGTATVNGSRIIVVGARAIDCWELSYSEYGYSYTFWYDKASGLWVAMETMDPYSGNRIGLLLVDTNVPIGTQYEHDLGVSLDAPQSLQPGETSLLNATVYNLGLNNETSVEVYLLINGTEVASEMLSELVNGTWYTIDYSWAPTTEGIYNITAYAPPVFGENVTINNIATEMVNVRYIEVALISEYSELMVITPILDSMGIGYDIYNNNYMNLYTEDLDLLLNYKAVILYTSGRWITPDEYSTLESYLSLGGNLLVTGYDCLVGDSLLANLVRSSSIGDNTGEPDLYVVDEMHPIMNGPYGSFPAGYHIYGLSSDCDMAEADTTRNAVTVAELADGYDRIIATEGLPGKVVFWNGVGTEDWTWNSDCEAMFKNMIHWFTVRYEHELVVFLDAPSFLEPGDSALLNATVQNQGLNNETDVELQLLINSTMIENVTIPQLLSGESHTISHLWTPALAGTYNLTVYAPPVLGEDITRNNMYSRLVPVRYAPRILAYVQYTDLYQDYPNTLRAIESAFGPNYILTELWDYTQLDSMLPGKDILLIPDQEYESLYIMEMIGAAWSETLAEFLENGGILILCDGGWGYGGTYGILTGADLMSISHTNDRSYYPLYLADPSDPLAEGVSSSFVAPYYTVSFATEETNVVIDDEWHDPVVIHKEMGLGHIALLGFDFESSNADTEKVLGNAVALAAYITISIDPSAGSPETEVTVTGTKATANSTVSIYWDSILIGNTTSNAVGNFTYLLMVPINATVGVHEITAVDTATGRTASTPFRVILIALNPAEGSAGTKVTVNGAGFTPESQATVTFNDMLIGYAKVDNFGNFTFTFNIPLSSAETQVIKALDAEANYARATFTVIDVTPLGVQIDVGAMHFIGEIAEFCAQTTFKGQAVNATITSALLYKPDGTTEGLTAQPVTTGLYKILYTIVGNETGTYTLVINASYVTNTVRANGTSFKCFLVSDALTLMNKQVMEIRDGVAMVQTDLGFVKLNLTAMNATLENIFLKVIAINGTTATIQTTLGIMNGTVTGTIVGDLATIVVPGVGQIETDISSLKETQETWIIPMYVIIMIIALIAAVSSTLSAIFLRRRKTTEAE